MKASHPPFPFDQQSLVAHSFLCPDLGSELIANAADGPEQRLVAERGAGQTGQALERALGDDHVGSEAPQDLVLGQQPVGILRQESQEGPDLGLEVDPLAGADELVPIAVDDTIGEVQLHAWSLHNAIVEAPRDVVAGSAS